MEFTAEQHNFLGEPARFFLMDARRGRLPVDVFHAFHDQSASMRVRLLSLIPLVDASGDSLEFKIADFGLAHARRADGAWADQMSWASSGTPPSRIARSMSGAPSSRTLEGPPDRMIPAGCHASISDRDMWKG